MHANPAPAFAAPQTISARSPAECARRQWRAAVEWDPWNPPSRLSWRELTAWEARLSTTRNETQGLSGLLFKKLLLGECDCLLSLRRVGESAARKITRAAAFARESRNNLPQQRVHVFPHRRVLRKKQVTFCGHSQQRHGLLRFSD